LKRAVLIAFLCAVVLAISAPPHWRFASGFSGSGSGTTEDPYIITTVGQLQEIENNLTAHYILGNDIDASETINWNGGAGFEPVGTATNMFTGSLDGRRYRITDLYIDMSGTDNVGLFGYVGDGGVVENVWLENENVRGSCFTGGFIGVNLGIVLNCYSTGPVVGDDYVGGLVGGSTGIVSNCYSTGPVVGDNYVGGLVGYNVGTEYGTGTISNSYSTGPVSGDDYVGGLVGGNEGYLSNSYSTGPVVGDNYVGGLVGGNEVAISDSYSTSSVSGNGDVGGLVGYNGMTISNCYSTGPVVGDNYVGGLVGNNWGTVSNSFWDTQTSGQATSNGGTGKTTENMKNVRTYTDLAWSGGLSSAWNFVGVWSINPDVNDGYPFLTGVTLGAVPPEEFPWGLVLEIIAAVVIAIVIVALLYKRKH
jgi:methylglyoxal synthase